MRKVLYLDMDETFFKGCLWKIAKIEGYSWIEYTNNVLKIGKEFSSNLNIIKKVVGSQYRINRLKIWLKKLKKNGVIIHQLTTNYNLVTIPILKKIGVYHLFDLPFFDRDYMKKKKYNKADVITNNSGNQDKNLFLDDSLNNIIKANEKGINTIYINTNNGITPAIEKKVLNYFNIYQ